MIRSIDVSAAQSLAAAGLAQLVDGTWQMTGEAPLHGFLAGTTAVADTAAIKALPHDMRAAQAIGTFAASGMVDGRAVCVYDRAGFFSAPWVAWLLASHGHAVSLVTGDLCQAATTTEVQALPGERIASHADVSDMNAIRADVLATLETETQIVDARPEGRFKGISPEPRTGCRSGHIPGSLNLPFGQLKNGSGYQDFEDLGAIVRSKGIELSRPIITTCGSGVTASAVAVVLQRLGAREVRVYQGSWAEWGMDSDLPIETGAT